MKTYSYKVEINIDETEFLLFVNGVLNSPGIDFIKKSKSMYEGTEIIFKNKLLDGDLICLAIYKDIYWFKVVGHNLVDQSQDSLPGFTFTRYTKWMKVTEGAIL